MNGLTPGEWTAVHLLICKKSSVDEAATINRLNRENLIVAEGRRGWTLGLPACLLPNEKKSNVARKIDIRSQAGNRRFVLRTASNVMLSHRGLNAKTDRK